MGENKEGVGVGENKEGVGRMKRGGTSGGVGTTVGRMIVKLYVCVRTL